MTTNKVVQKYKHRDPKIKTLRLLKVQAMTSRMALDVYVEVKPPDWKSESNSLPGWAGWKWIMLGKTFKP